MCIQAPLCAHVDLSAYLAPVPSKPPTRPHTQPRVHIAMHASPHSIPIHAHACMHASHTHKCTHAVHFYTHTQVGLLLTTILSPSGCSNPQSPKTSGPLSVWPLRTGSGIVHRRRNTHTHTHTQTHTHTHTHTQ